MAASVKQRLLNQARSEGRELQSLLTMYAMEGFLRRLSASSYADRFVLKGGLLLRVWEGGAARPTVDADFLGYVENDPESLARIAREICASEVTDDGMRYDLQTLRSEPIAEDTDYGGVRVTFTAYLGKARARMRIDIGFGDVVVPPPERVAYPVLLADMERPNLRVYSRESTVAEKFEAMARLGDLNSRMKDFYDIWTLSRHFAFDGSVLRRAVSETFHQRRAEVPEQARAFGPSFAESETKQVQWAAFLRKGRLEGAPREFARLMRDVVLFLGPVARACSRGEPLDLHWQPPGPWQDA